jgi:hypothetical protein
MASRDESDEKFDWSKTWLAEMFMSGEEAVKREAAMERLKGITPEVKRRREIKAGVITASAGVGLMIVLFVIMGGVIASGRVSDAAAEILSRIWIAGVIPLMVGAALIFNGMIVSKRENLSIPETTDPEAKKLPDAGSELYLTAAETNDLVSSSPFSVTEQTTKHLKQPRE